MISASGLIFTFYFPSNVPNNLEFCFWISLPALLSIMFVSKARAYISNIRNIKNKHSSLLCPLMNYKEQSVVNVSPGT